MKKGNDKLTISVNKRIKNKYKRICEKEGLKIGKQIELFMLNELKKRKKKWENIKEKIGKRKNKIRT